MPSPRKALPPRIRRLAVLARLRLIWETYAPPLRWVLVALALFLTATWFGLWEVVGDPVRWLAVLALMIVTVRGLWASRSLRWPTHSDALRRLEQTAGLSHRPLDTLVDQPVLSPDLWPLHARQARDKSEGIRWVGRTPALTPKDPYFLRFILPLGLIAALFLNFGFGAERLRHAFTPGWLSPTNPYDVTFEAWVDPPEYTGRPPIYAQGTEPIKAPAGSTLVVRASGAQTLPRPRLVENGDARFLNVRSLGTRSLDVKTVINAPATLSWRIGPRLTQFVVDTQPDLPPVITVPEPTETDKRDRLVVSFDAEDDYGVDRVLLEMIELTDDLDVANYFAGETSETDTGSPPFKTAEGRSLKLDLTRHPLAGKKVVGRLVAVDGADQRGVSEPLFFTVPDKIFVEPLAKAIAEQRTLLMTGVEAGEYRPLPRGRRPDLDASDGVFDTYQSEWRMDRAPAPVQRAAHLIEAVTDYPTPTLFNDPLIYVGLRHVGKTLRYSTSSDALDGLPEHMWKLAIRAEFGVLGTALQEMQEAEAALREGIARRASEREIDTLFTRYNQAVDNYMEELRRNATVSDGEGGGQGQSMGSVDQIQELLDAIEEANARGDTEGARRALAQLAELLENLEIQLSQGGGEGEGAPSDGEFSEEQQEALEDLAELLGDQRELQDETTQTEREQRQQELFGSPAGPGEEEDGTAGQGGLSPQELANRQAELSELLERLEEEGRIATGQDETGEGAGVGSLEELLDQIRSGGGEDGEETAAAISDGFSAAEEAMRRSEEALQSGNMTGSREAQSEAIQALRSAGEALASAASADQQGQDGEGNDPLGRDMNGFNSDNAESDIEERDNATRSREILEELRRRAAEAEREQQERDYLDRLLKRY